jgi:hypothetical protein
MEGVVMRREGEVSREIDGRQYTGHYHVDKGILTVSHGGYSENTQVGNHFLNSKPLAEIMLGKLVAQARKDGAA